MGKMRRIIMGIMIGAISFVGSCFIIIYCWHSIKNYKRRPIKISKPKRKQNFEAFLEQHGPLFPKRYRYVEVKKMTESFSEKLGQGGYGVVFKGKLSNGSLVAVKVMKKSKGNGEEFLNEVASIGQTHHVNIVRLIGFCCEGSKRALIYEFMSNGSLDKFMFPNNQRDMNPFMWEKLYDIIVGVARGLEYLHRGCSTHIVHFDIKPHNILLDEDFCPKISDFGLAKSCCPKESILSMSGARGTIGYIAPEVFSRNFGVVTSKSDVYSSGMMVLEMVGARRSLDTQIDHSSELYFPHWIYEQFDGDGILKICGLTIETEEIARKMFLVGLWCIQTIPSTRPTMSKVVEMLEGNIRDLQMPPKPYLSSPLRSNINSTI